MNYIGYIYITENLLDGKRYIGKRQKSSFDASYYGSGLRLRRAIDKYGIENFKVSILKWCSSIEELNESEREFIKEYNAQKSEEFYNISEGGDWGDVSRGMTKEEKISWGNKIREHHIGTKHSEETKRKISEARKGVVFSKETINKMRINNAGKNNPMYGKSHSSETKEKMSQNNAMNKAVIMSLNGEEREFPSLKKCFEFLNKTYNISIGTVKTIIKEGKPYQSKIKRLNPLNGLELKYR